MTISPESRAQMIIDALCDDQHADARALIIAAIREAEDAALERAASLFLDQTVVPTVIRALQHKD